MSAEGSTRALRVVAVAAALGAVMLIGIGPAFAQTPTTYVGPTTTTVCSGPSSDLGTLNVGETKSSTPVGAFNDNSTTSLSLNQGAAFGTAQADSNGCVVVTVTPTASGNALGGAHLLAVQGLRLAATGSTVTINGVTGLTALPPGQQNVVSVTGTLGSSSVTRTVLFKVAGPGVAGNGLSRTGAMILRWTIVALVLIALGTLVLLFNRKRTAATR